MDSYNAQDEVFETTEFGVVRGIELSYWSDINRLALAALADEVRQHGLDKHIRLFDDDTLITVYGGVSEIVNWAMQQIVLVANRYRTVNLIPF